MHAFGHMRETQRQTSKASTRKSVRMDKNARRGTRRTLLPTCWGPRGAAGFRRLLLLSSHEKNRRNEDFLKWMLSNSYRRAAASMAPRREIGRGKNYQS